MREEGTHLSNNEQAWRRDYRKDALFCACTFMLNKLKRIGEIPLSDVAVWHETECISQELLTFDTDRDIEICHIHTELEERYRQLYTEEQTQNTVVVVLFILLMQMASADPGDGGTHPNAELERAICRELTDDNATYKYFLKLRNAFEDSLLSNRKALNVLPVKDYMQANFPTSNEERKMIERILKQTKILDQERLLSISWETYCHIWEAICADKELLQRLAWESPKGNEWGFNLKLVCNVLGMLKNTLFRDANGKEKYCLTGANRWIAQLIAEQNKRIYIDNPVPTEGGNNSAFTLPQYQRVRSMLTVALKR